MATENKDDIVLSVKDLGVEFRTDEGLVKAVRGVSFDLHHGETLCIVGESGSGKSVSCKAIMGILPGNAIINSGSIMYEGEDLTKVSEEDFHRIRGKKIGMIFQDPLSSLNPIMRIGKQITEVSLINRNKLKRYESNLYFNELVAAKNSKAKMQHAIAHEKHIYENACHDIDANAALSKNDKKAQKATLKATMKAAIKEAKKTYSETKKPLNDALKLAKKNAHIKTLEYKASLIKTRDEKLADIAKRRVGLTDKEAIKKLDEEAFKVKDEYINSTRLTRKQAKLDALKVMEEVGIPYPEKRYKQYPFEFSGGMRQRIVIAIALTANPDILICDEPTTALDVTIQAQILALINKLKESRHMSVIFITHDLGVVANMADRVAVMYAGKIVEYGKVNEIFYDPRHPYTWALLSSIPDIDSKERLDAIPGTPPNMLFPPKGDAFAFRSKYAMKIDFEKQPPYFEISPTHYAATWLLYPGAPKVEMPRIVSTRIANSLKKEGITREQALKQ
jgi:oligopeptide transport system ATP-binding protein